MTTPSRPFAVVGGGLTGLVAAYTLRHTPPWPPVVVYESDTRLGGKIRTARCADATIESGADSFLAREPVVVDLCIELGLAEELVKPAIYGAQIWVGDELHPLPVGFLRGLPTSVRAALDASVLSTPAALRTAIDLIWPRRLAGGDVAFGNLVARRFGSQVRDRLVSSVLAGTRAGIPEEISLSAAAPEVDEIARNNRSIMRGLARTRSEGKIEAGLPPFRSLKDGLSRLIERLREHLGSVDIRTGTEVDSIESTEDGYYIVTADGAREPVAGVVVTTPTAATARIVGDLAPAAAAELDAIRYASVAAITLVYPPDTVSLPDGSGVLVPASQERDISACTWFSRKWPHHAPLDGSEVIRAFIGRAGRPAILERSDEELARLAQREIGELLGASASPRDTCVRRWDDGLPQYEVGHLDRVARIERALVGHPVFVAGAGLRGSGIPDCVKQGRAAASALIAATVGSPT